MTDETKCPKCGADPVPCGPMHDDYCAKRWACGSYVPDCNFVMTDEFQQHYQCEIAMLRAENDELRRSKPGMTAMRIDSSDGKFWCDLIDWLDKQSPREASTTITVLETSR